MGLDKLKKGKKKLKAGEAPPPPLTFSSLTIFYAQEYQPWQKSILEMLHRTTDE